MNCPDPRHSHRLQWTDVVQVHDCPTCGTKTASIGLGKAPVIATPDDSSNAESVEKHG